jgi:tetratricopeptide (TPR) repeat protein
MRDAEEALRFGDLELARANYWGALRFDPLNIIARMRLGLVFKRQGRHYEALEEFTTVTKLAPTYGEAWKEKGVVEGRIARLIPPDKRNGARWLQDGYASLDRARMLIPEDFDVWSSLGGVLKNVRNEPKQALKMYDKAASISDGHPYPLLNALKLRAQEMKTLDIEAIRPQLENARKLREGQALNEPPTDTPWCYFDLAEISLYQGDEQGFLEYVEKGIKASYSSAELETFRSSLDDCLLKNGIMLAGLEAGIALLDKAIGTYMKS